MRHCKQPRRVYKRRAYRPVCFIATEGSVTEPEYFSLFHGRSRYALRIIPARGASAPVNVLRRLQYEIGVQGLRDHDRAWLVVDRDAWPESMLRNILAWVERHRHRGLAVSSPSFEYWLLLHFTQPMQHVTGAECRSALRRYLPGYNKHVDARHFTDERIASARMRARSGMTRMEESVAWTDANGTTVHILVDLLLDDHSAGDGC